MQMSIKYNSEYNYRSMNRTSTRAGRPKGDKRQRTRDALIKAASEVIGEKGWDRTSLEEVAARAGMTRGAIYGNFKHREDLYISVVRAQWKPVIPPLVPGTPFAEYIRTLGRAVAAAAPERRAQAVGALSFMLYAMTHDEMRTRVRNVNAEIYRVGAERMEQAFQPEELPMAPERLVRVLHALTDGLTFLRFLTPELITDAVVIAAFEALAPLRRDPPTRVPSTASAPNRTSQLAAKPRLRTAQRRNPRFQRNNRSS
jgi:AcrR family transcriptional regulator